LLQAFPVLDTGISGNGTIQPAAAKRLAIRTDPIRRSVAIDGSA
jgi:hypothetical protein